MHCQDLGAWKCKNVAFQNLACQVLNKKVIMFTCVHVLENQVMKDIILTYTVEIIYPKRIQDLESQVLNNAIIVKTWEHGIAKQCNISKLGMPSLEQKSDTFQKLVCQVLTIIFLCSCLGKTKS